MRLSTSPPNVGEAELLALLDWKRTVFELYAAVRNSPDPRAGWDGWRAARDELFRVHRQSPLPLDLRESLPGVPCFEYDPSARVLADVRPVAPETLAIGTSHPDPLEFTRFGLASFELQGTRSHSSSTGSRATAAGSCFRSAIRRAGT